MLIQCLLAAILVFQACLATPFGLKPKITDGEDATPGEFPYQVSIRWGIPPVIPLKHACGGSILNESYVLTAAHCVLKYGKLKVLAGKHHISKNEDTQQEVAVEKAFVYEDYPGGVAPYDIAILKLKTPLIFNERVSAVFLPQQNEIRTGNAVLSGWGSISKNLRPVLPDALQKVTVPLLDNLSCLNKFPNNIIGKKPELYDSQICTDSVGEVSACSGDSGGPLVQFENNTPIQIGIVSWGVLPCGVNHVPSVYTRVASYVDWIKMTIWLDMVKPNITWICIDYNGLSMQSYYRTELLSKMSIKCNHFAELASIDKMSPKAIVFFALLTVAFAGPAVLHKPHLGLRVPFLPQVVGGSEAPKNGYPFIVSLQQYDSHFCAGSIINSQWVITAAHCILAVNSFIVKSGKHNILITEDTEQTAQIAKTFVHENYQGGVGPFDIGLVKLQTPLKLTKEVQPIDLPEPGSNPTEDAILCGWGSVSESWLPDMPEKLQCVDLHYIDLDVCDEAVKRLTGSSPVHETNVCTGPLTGGISACSGDSGGSLFSIIEEKPVLTGIVSWGIIPCGTLGAPSVYTGVSKYISWIQNIIEKN
ncbi:transmembrane protease serine 9-like [Polyergus mexicanus]|uniref:transmembrane protease serine 9-like n=1 Tax=Polyergus mexicanus TaxID=615972 RepID=UPI0038B50DF8